MHNQASLDARRQLVLERIRESKQGFTLRELSADTGFEYYTLRNYVKALEAAGLVEINPALLRNRSDVYVVPSTSTIPPFGQTQNIWNLILAQSKTDDVMHFSGYSYRFFLRKCLDLFNYGDMAISDGPKPTIKELTALRTNFIENRERLMVLVKAHDQIINNPNLVDPTKIGKVLFGDKTVPIPPDEYKTAFSTLGEKIYKAGKRL